MGDPPDGHASGTGQVRYPNWYRSYQAAEAGQRFTAWCLASPTPGEREVAAELANLRELAME